MLSKTFNYIVITSLTTLCFLVVSNKTALCQSAVQPSSAPQISGSLRVRPEFWQWFEPKSPGTSTSDYSFTGSIFRLGIQGAIPYGSYTFELADSWLVGLPEHASAPSPLGTFGAGSNYFAYSGGTKNSLFVKQAVVNFKGTDKRNTLSLGRFDFNEGMETKPADPSLLWLQQSRITQRLIGTFGWTDIGRSFDGVKFVHNAPNLNITGVASSPTQGAFTLHDNNDNMDHVRVDYIGLTLPQTSKTSPVLARLFAIYYEDNRNVVKTDNRALAVRKTDTAPIKITTIGANYTRLLPTTSGKFDVLAWGSDQFGDWGVQSHNAYAYDVELGYQPKRSRLKSWLRAGYYFASGDSNTADSRHASFFPILPTPRIYARFPFYSETNLKDLFVQAILRPNPKTSLRADWHDLRLANSGDLWYQGGGAFVNEGNFGYAGTTSSGKSDLATLWDLSVDYKISRQTAISLYYGYATPRNVVKALYTNKAAHLGYVELTESF